MRKKCLQKFAYKIGPPHSLFNKQFLIVRHGLQNIQLIQLFNFREILDVVMINTFVTGDKK